MPGSYRIGVDIGGTFTDFTMVDDRTGDVFVEKCLTTPDRPERAVLEGMRRFKQLRADTLHNAEAVIHATTLLTNVVLERKGALTGLLTTAGFRDVLEFAREMRYDIYDPFIEFPEPLVERPLRIGVPERVLVDGAVHVPLDEDAVRAAASGVPRRPAWSRWRSAFLHSLPQPRPRAARARDPRRRACPAWFVDPSAEVHPETREYERTSTTVVDAYVKPTAAQYLDRLSAELRADGYPNNLFVMLSNGGTATAETTKRFPVQAVESGPAAGVEAAAHYGRLIGARRLLSFDMGGTTAKLCVVLDGKPLHASFEVDRVQRFKPGSGIPIATPVYDLLEIGAGGGSIARVDALGLMQVGPRQRRRQPRPGLLRPGRHRTPDGDRCRPGARLPRPRLASSAAR